MKINESIFEQILACTGQWFVLVSAEGKCTYLSQGLASSLGYEQGLSPEELFSSICPELCQQVSSSKYSFQAKSGRFEDYVISERCLENGVRLFIVFPEDTSAEVRFHSQRLETLGMLAGGVAHDFNNVLAGILGHITYLKTILPQNGNHVESLTAIEEGANKASFLTQEILNFSRLRVSKPEPVLLNSLLEKSFTLLRGAISPEYNMTLEVPDRELYTIGVEGKLAQIVINLTMNARDALEADGTITIRLTTSSQPGVLPREVLDQMKLESAVLQVHDNGCGMPPEVLARAFEPYFSTKETRGTGLGLSTVGQIVDSMGARILVDSTVDKGTSFSVLFPLCSAGGGNETAITGAEKRELPTGTERILVVDDEEPVRNVLSKSLSHLGYSVDVAENGEQALAKYNGDNGPYDLVILDMLMPQMSGEQVFFALKEHSSDVAVLVISGFTSEESVTRILDGGGKGFIQKPFTIEALAQKVRECVGE